MQISKIKIRNALGISEVNVTPGQITEVVGKKGTGKTSFLDALIMALENKNVRSEFVKKGEEESEIMVELDNGTVIDRKKRLKTSDYISVKDSNAIVSSPESYLKKLFSNEQFNPLRFIELDAKHQAKILLSLVEIDWSKKDFIEWFGEIPNEEKIDIDSDHILKILDFLGGKSSQWYLKREEINRRSKQKEAVRNDELGSLPDNYQVDKWRSVNLSEMYAEASKAQEFNNSLDRAKATLEQLEGKKEGIKAQYELAKEKLRAEIVMAKQNIKNAIDDCASNIREVDEWERKEIERIKQEASLKKQTHTLILEDAKTNLNAKINTLENGLSKQDILLDGELERESIIADKAEEVVAENEYKEFDALMEKAKESEIMKGYINTYDKAKALDLEINDLNSISLSYTDKIEKARTLPSELLETCIMPVEGLSVEDGEVLIKGMSINNLSTGETLELAVDIAVEKVGELKVIFVDRLEGLDTESREIFINKCRESGLQFFMTRVTDDEFEIRGL